MPCVPGDSFYSCPGASHKSSKRERRPPMYPKEQKQAGGLKRLIS
nr:MAG TPA: hypothetical protein [Caudoviricetes sp.]